jgi:molybdate transport system substrate-binding protein
MRLLVLVVATALALRPAMAGGEELTLSVAISMKEAVAEMGRRFAEGRRAVTVRYNFGGSGELQKQIEAGAPIDVFVSAAAWPMDELERRGFVIPGSRRDFARNTLVVVTPADTRFPLAGPADLAGPRVGRIVIGNPRTVPAGQYARESLRALRLWDRVESRLVFAENVRQALEYVARGEVDAGLVYATDLGVRAGRVKEAFRPPEDTYRPIVYPVAVVTGSRHRELAMAFVGLLTGAEGQAVLAKFGFRPPVPR